MPPIPLLSSLVPGDSYSGSPVEQGLAKKQDNLIRFRANLLGLLARQELEEMSQALALKEGGSFHMVPR